MKIEDISKEQINYLKTNKDQITYDLLQSLRKFGNAGKQLCLDILETEKNDEGFFLDAFGNKISFHGNRFLKKAYTKMNLSKIHLDEIKRCKDDIEYFKDNYVKITTKSGINFPELREYQNRLLDVLSDKDEEFPGQNESIVGLLSRQSGKSITTAIYLSHKYNFSSEKIIIGITAYKAKLAREFLSNVKNILTALPMWMVQGTTIWNTGSIGNESQSRILTDSPSAGSFRGFTCLGGEHEVQLYDKFEDKYITMQLKNLYKNLED